MKQALLIFSVLGIGMMQIGAAAETTQQSNNTLSDTVANNSTPSRNSYRTTSDAYVYSNEEISQAIDNLYTYEKQKEYQLNQMIAKIVETKKELAKKPKLRIGMSTDQVLHNSNWGKPDDINTTINSYGKFEQWIYGRGKYLYFTNGKLTSIQY
mgnify:CR=1 FL=1